MNETKEKDIIDFSGLNIKPQILSVLKKMGIESPTPIQFKSIPTAISGKDLFGVAQTGTGKTFAFGIPMVQRLKENGGRALVLLPTRELANQVEENLKKLAESLGLKTISIIGGEPFVRQLSGLKRNPDIIVATPGRLLDHIRRRTVKLNDISILTLDEADMMFDMGFAPQIEEVIKLTPASRQTLLFSATMPAVIIKLAEKYLKSPLQIQVAPSGSTADLVDQEIYLIKSEDKFNTLENILKDYDNLVLIFVRTRRGASSLSEKLYKRGYGVSEIHSNLSFNQRKRSLMNFKSGAKRILVATDVAARGLDIKDIQLVLNYDLPDNSEDYVHRVGRTARAGKGGKAISLSLFHQRRDVQKIERLIKKNLPVIKIGFRDDKMKKTLLDDKEKNKKVKPFRGRTGKRRSGSRNKNNSFNRKFKK
jgi:ATP-dependent RNA helicase RhlE